MENNEALKTGADVLNAVNAEIEKGQKDALFGILRDTVVGIRRREGWIEARTVQKEQLAAIQVEAVKAFDEGAFTKGKVKEFRDRLAKLENERVSDNEAF